MPDTFDTILLIARPAAGKSEVINYLKHTPVEERRERFHITDFLETDDFPMLWTWFEEDALLEEMGLERLHTDAEGYFKFEDLWHLLIRRLCLEHTKIRRDHKEETIIIEFSRGSEHGGYCAAFQHLTPDVLSRLAILYIDVPWEESLRKNRRRFNPNRPDSILEHGLSDTKLERLYKEVDWAEVSAGTDGFLEIQGVRVPYAIFHNEDDVTTAQGSALGDRLETVLGTLWQRYQSLH
ncbi:MAG: hypothetical protein JW750_01900 [Anaerolineaceae bacterium]|nr:hypothetical protein [Anaerolineaceae bacterium]